MMCVEVNNCLSVGVFLIVFFNGVQKRKQSVLSSSLVYWGKKLLCAQITKV